MAQDSIEGLTYVVHAAARRLDAYLVGQVESASRTRIQRLIAAGRVTVNGQIPRAATPLSPGDVVHVKAPVKEQWTAAEPAERPELRVLYEDEHMLVVDKPAGLATHAGAGRAARTLVDLVVARRAAIAGVGPDPARAGIVHRLDRGTSGVMVVACSNEALHSLQRQFRQHQVEKVYIALVVGNVTPDVAAIEAPLGRDPADRRRRAVVEGGKSARTEYVVLERLQGFCLVQVRILTGRTHQIRAHFAAVGHPLVGDRVYGDRSRLAAERQFLHAYRLTFYHPQSCRPMTFESPLPDDLERTLATARGLHDNGNGARRA